MAHFLFLISVFFTVIFGTRNSVLDVLEIPRANVHTNSPQSTLNQNSQTISFSERWQILGPFRSGTREATWGADPLENQGGFSKLPYNDTARFSSALATNGTVKWDQILVKPSCPAFGQSRAELNISFPEIDWNFLQSIYGWSALQFQAWARGQLQLHGPSHQTVAIFTDGILEFLIDGQRHFGGDFYSYRRAPLILKLAPGQHVIELRLVRDVRALGGLGEPTINVAIEAETRPEILSVNTRSLLIPETMRGKLASTWASIDVQNNHNGSVEIFSLSSPGAISLIMENPFNLSAYQTRPLSFQIAAQDVMETEFSININYKALLKNEVSNCLTFKMKFTSRSISDPQRLTYLHPAKIVSYAILRPPPLHSNCTIDRANYSMPVLLGLHGAGLEADSVQVREMLNAAYGICAWILFPSGVTSWSGDDWHTWGAADVKAAVGAVSKWIENVNWSGPGISSSDWIVVGHSNGGQGVWFLATHYPDNIIAAAPVSGYSSIENYVPYNMWQDSEPLLSSILQQSRSSYKHELLLGNLAGIPVLQQHGSIDKNVPAYHSRLLHELFQKYGWSSEYNELPNKDHWFDGVMTTPSLLEFYQNSVDSLRKSPLTYTLTVPPSGEMCSKGGVHVDQLQSPDLNGQVKVRLDLEKGLLFLATTNIHRLHLSHMVCQAVTPLSLILDNAKNNSFEVDPDECDLTWYIKSPTGSWVRSKSFKWQSLSQRYGRQSGAMDAVLRTNGPFTITICSTGIESIALQISRNVLQYFGADSHIVRQADYLTNASKSGNIITLSIGDDLPDSKYLAFPIRAGEGYITLYKNCPEPFSHEEIDFNIIQQCQYSHTFPYEHGLGALFIRPLENEHLELVVWGSDMDGLEQAARLVPTITGVGQPEFLVMSSNCRWEGHAGLYAAGHFDKFWQISQGSFIRV